MRLDARKIGLYNKRVLCAVSGGADSVALLRLLCDLRDAGELELIAAHFEHGIRGEASLEDMRFTQELCDRLKVPLTIGRADVPAVAAAAKEGLESCARRLRHSFLKQTRKELNCDYIALAHHKRDRAETVLMHLLRGGGLKGAAAMPQIDGVLARPLIDTSPEELREYLISINQGWREDASNFVPDNARNALRLNVFPEIRKIYTGFEDALCRFSSIARDEDALLNELTEQYIKQSLSTYAGVLILKKGNIALMRRALRRIVPDISYENISLALAAAETRDICGGYTAHGDRENLYITPPLEMPAQQKLNLNGKTILNGVCEIISAPSEAIPIKNNGCTQVFKLSAVEGAVVRLRREGDYICPFGLNGKRKSLGDYLTDRHFPLPLRDRLPLLARDNEILWVPEVGISEKLRVKGDEPALKLKIHII